MHGIHLQSSLDIISEPNTINHITPTGLAIPPTINKNIRLFSIAKSFDYHKFSDSDKLIIKNNLVNILGDDFSKYKIVFAFEKQESKTTRNEIEFFKSVFGVSNCLTITNNIEEIVPYEVIFLNNPTWVLADLDNHNFFQFWKYLKKKDLGTIKKKFMFLNNHYSDIRFNILKFIYKNGFDKFGNISFNEILFKEPHINLDEEKFLKEVKEYGIEYPKFYDTLPDTSQINEEYLTRKKLLGINHATTLPDFNYRIFIESFFEIITESAPHLVLPGVHISEKIHKPLRTALPFVYYGNPKLKSILENIGLSFNSPIYFFGMNDEELFEHLNQIINKDFEWYHQTQYEYLDEYLNNMDKWNNFIKKNNMEILKYIYE